MSSDECPVCGAENYHYESGWQNGEPIEPDEAWCDVCGYHWQQHCKHPESEQIANFKIGKYDELRSEIDRLMLWIKHYGIDDKVNQGGKP